MNLTVQDYDVILNAMDCWVQYPTHSTMISEVFAMAGGTTRGMSEAQLTAKNKAKEKKLEDETKIRSERATLLKAKIIGLRDSLAAGQVLDDARAS